MTAKVQSCCCVAFWAMAGNIFDLQELLLLLNLVKRVSKVVSSSRCYAVPSRTQLYDFCYSLFYYRVSFVLMGVINKDIELIEWFIVISVLIIGVLHRQFKVLEVVF